MQKLDDMIKCNQIKFFSIRTLLQSPMKRKTIKYNLMLHIEIGFGLMIPNSKNVMFQCGRGKMFPKPVLLKLN